MILKIVMSRFARLLNTWLEAGCEKKEVLQTRSEISNISTCILKTPHIPPLAIEWWPPKMKSHPEGLQNISAFLQVNFIISIDFLSCLVAVNHNLGLIKHSVNS